MSSPAVVFKGRYRVPASALTLPGYLRWAHSTKFPRRGRVSFISGEVHLDMSPEEINTHNSVKGDVFGAIWNQVRTENLGMVFADRVLLVNEGAELATEPDIMFCGWESLQSGRVNLMERQPGSGRQVEVNGSPDLVVEIVSKSSVQKDREKLRDAYHRAKISEYWLIDARKDDLEFSVLQRNDDGYCQSSIDGDGYQSSTTLARRVKLTPELNRIGGWRYTLHLE